MIKINKETYMDKLHACWLGKNIGGTLGAPFEGQRELLDIQGFTSKEGEPLPNDDLDLQLVWLAALEQIGAERLDSSVLAEYWLDWIPPHWNEYGIAKTNLRIGLLPPMSGELDNEKWKNSNGAWIRSEVWAGLAPAVTDVAIKYAMEDAMVDHGLSEGTFAEVFTVVLQSTAYRESDIRVLLDTALSKIPESSMVARTVRLVIDCYDSGVSFKEARERVVEFNKELGWFQAPGNIGFVVIGLLYGEGDFRKSILYAVNCGDDTDCTAGTVGATLGIMGGTAAIPEDFKSFVGDKIVTISINGMYAVHIPKTCTELAERVAALVPEVMKANKVKFEFTDGESEYPKKLMDKHCNATSDDFFNRSRYSYEISNYNAFRARVELDKTPRVAPGDKRQVKLSFFCNRKHGESRKLQVRLLLPEGWSVGAYDKTVSLPYRQPPHGIFGDASISFEITAGEKIDVTNRVYAEVTCPTLPYTAMIPIIFVG